MNELHLFAGAGGGILGGMLLGHTCVCAVEIDPYCRKVLLQRQRDGILPKFPIWDDVRTFDGRPWRESVHVICAGFPCQSFSTASRGRRTALNLWGETLHIIGEIRPNLVFLENVSRRAIETAASDLSYLGYRCKAIPLSASDMGADHVRRRYWLLAYADNQSELLRLYDDEMAIGEAVPPSIWASFPDNSRMANGLANRMERYKATGNGQVPAVVKLAWETLSQ